MSRLLTHILILWAAAVLAQSPATLSVYTTQQGLPSNCIRGVAMDKDGQLWVSTDNGLYLNSHFSGRNNGEHLYQEKRGVSDGSHICSNDLNMIYADSNEPILWIATRASGLDAFHYAEGRFVHYPPNPTSNEKKACTHSPYLPDGSVTCIAPWKDSTLWMTSYQGGFCSLDKHTGLFSHYHHPAFPGMPNDSLWCIMPLTDSTLVVGHTNAGISFINLQKKKAANYPICHCFKEKYVAEDGIRTMVIDKHGNLWLGTEKGLAVFDMKRRKVREIRGIRGLVTHLSASHDTLYICTRDMGLCTLSLSEAYRKSYRPEIYPIDLSQAGLSSSLPVTTCLADSQGHRYVGTLEEGLVLLRKHAPYISPLDLPGEIKSNVTSLLAVTEEDIWIGTYQNGLYRWNLRRGTCRHLPLVDADGGRRIFVNALTMWKGQVMVATGQGLFAICPRDESYRCHTRSDGGLSSSYLTTLAVDSYQRLWCGSAYGHIDIIDSTFHRVCGTHTKRMGTNHAMRIFASLGKDTMAAANDNEFFLLKYAENSEPKKLWFPEADSTLSSSCVVKTMLTDRQGNLLLFTPMGVMGMENGKFTCHYPCRHTDELSNCHVATLMPGGEILWFARHRLGLMSQHPTSLAASTSRKPLAWLPMAALTLLLATAGYLARRKHRTPHLPEQGTEADMTHDREESNAFLDRLNEKVDALDSLASLNRDTLAGEMCMSTSTLYRRMKQELGKSPNEWIRGKKLERAHRLLAQGRNVSETAASIGLDAAYLARCYKEQYGVYPSEMKK